MKLLTLCFFSMLCVSCGKKDEHRTYIENPYDDSKLRANLLIQDSRLIALEEKTAELEQLLNTVKSGLEMTNDDVESLKQSLEADYQDVIARLDVIENTVNNAERIEIMSICGSGENLIKVGNKFYAVYMVSNNYGTYLGKLQENMNYQTTDIVKARFKIVNSTIFCQ